MDGNNILGWAAGQAFVDTTMGEAEEGFADDGPNNDLGQVLRDAWKDCESQKESEKLQCMIEDHKKLLYLDCKQGHKKLGSMLELLQWKSKNSVSDKAFEGMLKLVKKIVPENNELPSTTYKAKQVCPMGLEVQNIHSCPNDCILYCGDEYEKLDVCPVCGVMRYKISQDDAGDFEGQPSKKRVSSKVMWYFPIIQCLNNLFKNKAHAKLMQWHKE